jgi:hypothetical protein
MSSPVYPNPQAVFYQQYEVVRRDEIVGILLALFLGSFGILYCFFFWSGIPAILGFIECFFMPGRVREFNAIQAAGIAATLGIPVPGWGGAWQPVNINVKVPPAAAGMSQSGALVACSRCQQTNAAGARFCSGCGALLA